MGVHKGQQCRQQVWGCGNEPLLGTQGLLRVSGANPEAVLVCYGGLATPSATAAVRPVEALRSRTGLDVLRVMDGAVELAVQFDLSGSGTWVMVECSPRSWFAHLHRADLLRRHVVSFPFFASCSAAILIQANTWAAVPRRTMRFMASPP